MNWWRLRGGLRDLEVRDAEVLLGLRAAYALATIFVLRRRYEWSYPS
jgi:hypothetical protein